jgi:hypothetical protein
MPDYLIQMFLSRLAGRTAQKPVLAKRHFNKHLGSNFEISD